MKLKLNTGNKPASDSQDNASTIPQTIPTTSGGGGGGAGGFKLKIKTSAPPTPSNEKVPDASQGVAGGSIKIKRAYTKKSKDEATQSSASKKDKKRAAETDISPAPKRPAITTSASNTNGPPRKISFKISTAEPPPTPGNSSTGGPRLKLSSLSSASTTSILKTPLSAGPKNITLFTKRRPPPRPLGAGYDSEASDAETDPAIEQQFILRMPDPSRSEDVEEVKSDTEYIRRAIEDRTFGVSLAEGGADVSIRFVTRDLRRAVVTVRDRNWAAVLVDLPCVIESMKSWDRKGGWWKVADISQCLLVLGLIRDEGDEGDEGGNMLDEQIKKFPLPHTGEVEKDWRYAHGVTPPMYWVRKRRFRKRVDYRDIEDVEGEVEKLLKEDAECTARGGNVKWRVFDDVAQQQEEEEEDELIYDDEDDGNLEGGDYFSGMQGEDDTLLEADLLAGLEDLGEEEEQINTTIAPNLTRNNSELTTTGIIDARSSSIGAQGSSAPETPPAEITGPVESSDDDEDDEEDDENDDSDRAETVDEDAVAAERENAAEREKIADLEREVANKRAEYERTTNQLLKQRVRMNLKALEDELAMRKKAFNVGNEESDEDE